MSAHVERQQLVEQVRAYLADLPAEYRLDFIGAISWDFCLKCGETCTDVRWVCHCIRDE